MFSFRKARKVPAEQAAAMVPLSQKLGKTRGRLLGGLLELFRANAIDDAALEELESHLLLADVGVEVTGEVMKALRQAVSRREAADSAALRARLRELLLQILEPVAQPLELSNARPYVILVTGVNGVGKTTTVGKLAKQLGENGLSVMLAAGDTFRAAAVAQLQRWGERLSLPVVSQGSGADAASVIFDALQSARARGVDVLLADTAGRLHTQDGLMAELQKIKRVINKLDASAPHEVMLVVDGGTGQNALNQVRQFHQHLSLTGLIVTKLDGTAKGGVLFALAHTFRIPVRFIGVGESADDLRTFDAAEFVDALLDE